MQNKNHHPKKILAVKLADLGDALTITPALRALKATYPAARVEVLTDNGGPALQSLPYIDRVITFNKRIYDSRREALRPDNLLRAANFFRELALNRYDTVIFFHHFTLAFGALKFAALGLATLAPLRIGLDNGKGRAWFLNRKVADRGFGALTEREYWLELVAALGAQLPPGDDGRPELFVSPTARTTARNILNANRVLPLEASPNGFQRTLPDEKSEVRSQKSELEVPNSALSTQHSALGTNSVLIALAPGGGNYSLARRWYPVSFARVADKLVERYEAKILLMGSRDEIELANEVRELMQHPEAAVNLAGATSVPEAVALLEECRLFIGNDAGLTHLASVAGTPIVVIFGPTNAEAWKPFGEQVRVVQAPIELPCRPCLYRKFELGSRYGCAPRPCLSYISPEQVVEAAEELLGIAKFQSYET
jgi:heptosyltransferase-2